MSQLVRGSQCGSTLSSPRRGVSTASAVVGQRPARTVSTVAASTDDFITSPSRRSLADYPALPRRGVQCHAFDPKPDRGSGKTAGLQFNPIYAGIIGGFAALFLFQNPYIFAGLTILTIIPQNSATTSLNSLVLLFYDSGVFQNFAEAVYCVRLVSWLSIICMLISFAIFS